MLVLCCASRSPCLGINYGTCSIHLCKSVETACRSRMFLHIKTYRYNASCRRNKCWCHNSSALHSHLNDDVSLSGACAIELAMFLHHHDLALFFYLLHVLLDLVENAAVILLCYAHKLTEGKIIQRNEWRFPVIMKAVHWDVIIAKFSLITALFPSLMNRRCYITFAVNESSQTAEIVWAGITDNSLDAYFK